MTNEELWRAVLGQMELSISRANFITWFRHTTILSRENGAITIGVPNGYTKEWLENKYNHYILKALRELGENIQELRCVIIGDTPLASPERKSMDAVQAPISKQDSLPHIEQTTFQKPALSGPSLAPYQQKSFHSNLNSRYEFDNFVVAENNELAKAACFSVSQNLGVLYNPLFIYGGVGLGKTHLLQSIGNEILKNSPEKRIKYITSERFTTELVDSLKNHHIDEFKSFYEQIDLLIIDDIQFLSGREKTQNEFFHIFNALYQLNKQIVISSDRPPQAIATLEDRLRSRFEGGMITDISRPTLETRIAILERKMNEKNFSLDPASVRFVAENVTQNVRELEGALNRIIAFCEFHKIEPSLDATEKILSTIIAAKKQVLTLDDILAIITDFYAVTAEDLKKKGRKKEISHPRQVMMYLLRDELTLPFSTIGAYFHRDHTTILHAFEKIKTGKQKNPRLKEELSTITERLHYST